MKKIYSIVLMATMLLVSTSMWAQISLVYNEGGKADKTFTDLQAAIDYVAPGDSATITLNAKQTLEHGILIPHLTDADTVGGVRIANIARQRICIDLNGNDIEMESGVDDANFALLKGVLRITGSGTIKRDADRNGNVFHRCAIVVCGTDAVRPGYTGAEATADTDRSKQEWSTLYVDKDVVVTAKGNDVFAIGINEINASTCPNYRNFSTKYMGYSTTYDRGKQMWDPTTTGSQYSAFGAKVMVDGTVYGDVRGINVVGNINQTPGIAEGKTSRVKAAYPYYDHYFPYIWVGPNANVSCKPSGINDNGNGGIYVGGWAVIDVHGEVHGQTGIMVKAGDLKLIDGKVYSDDNTAANYSGNYHGTVGGSGIFVASSASYAGESSVAVTGDSYVGGASGSAIVDVCATSTTEQTTSAVTHVEITGGTIEGGAQGAISLGTTTENVTEIKGGNVNGIVDIGDASDTEQRFHTDVTTLLPDNTNYHTTTVTTTDPETGKKTTTVVVSGGAAPTVANTVIGATSGTSVNWQNTGTTAETLTEDKTLTELEINQTYNQTLTIAAGKKLTVGRVVLGEKAQIIVEAGAKFIVTGEQGIVAPSIENIVLKHNSNDGKYATFLFNPAVTSNRHPNAKVQFTTKSWRESDEAYQWEWFGVPTYNKAKSITSTGYAFIAVYENSAWTNLGYIGLTYDNNPAVLAKLDQPFAAYDLLAVRAHDAAAPEITIAGELVGNVNGALNAYMKWNPFANSYTAEVDAAKLIEALGASSNIADAIYVAKQNLNGSITWNAKISLNVGNLKLQPMQAFMLLNNQFVEEAAIDYASMVYAPATAASAPKKRAASENMTKVSINVANAEGTWDDVELFETNDAQSYEKYLNSDINIYVVDGEKNDIYTAENLENTYVGFSTVNGGKYTLSFENVEGREFDLIDLETGARVAVAEGFEYEFTADANSANDYRFKVVERNNAPTAIENTEAVKSAKGIYTITGQYLGEMNVWNTLPAGVYVVNGEKRVK